VASGDRITPCAAPYSSGRKQRHEAQPRGWACAPPPCHELSTLGNHGSFRSGNAHSSGAHSSGAHSGNSALDGSDRLVTGHSTLNDGNGGSGGGGSASSGAHSSGAPSWSSDCHSHVSSGAHSSGAPSGSEVLNRIGALSSGYDTALSGGSSSALGSGSDALSGGGDALNGISSLGDEAVPTGGGAIRFALDGSFALRVDDTLNRSWAFRIESAFSAYGSVLRSRRVALGGGGSSVCSICGALRGVGFTSGTHGKVDEPFVGHWDIVEHLIPHRKTQARAV
jgi:hypothetical protein